MRLQVLPVLRQLLVAHTRHLLLTSHLTLASSLSMQRLHRMANPLPMVADTNLLNRQLCRRLLVLEQRLLQHQQDLHHLLLSR